jgi:hypothetical protein
MLSNCVSMASVHAAPQKGQVGRLMRGYGAIQPITGTVLMEFFGLPSITRSL